MPYGWRESIVYSHGFRAESWGKSVPKDRRGAALSPRDEQKIRRWGGLIISGVYTGIAANLVILAAVWLLWIKGKSGMPEIQYWLRYILLPTAVILGLTGIADVISRRHHPSMAAQEA